MCGHKIETISKTDSREVKKNIFGWQINERSPPRRNGMPVFCISSLKSLSPIINPKDHLLYHETGFRQIKNRFLAATGNEAHFAKTAVRAQVNNFVPCFQFARIIIRSQRASIIIGCDIAGVRRKTDHFRGRITGKLISKYPVIHFQVGTDIELICSFVYIANNLPYCPGRQEHQQNKRKRFIHFRSIEK